MMFEGSTVALVTPHVNGLIDFSAFEQLIEFQIDQGTQNLLPCGCTGEAATLNHDEQIDICRFTVEIARGRVPVMAGTGSNNTEEAILLTKKAKDIGVDGVLLITPYYNKPTQKGLFEHYCAIAKAVDIPILLYNVPGRTSVTLDPKTVAELSKISSIVAIKEAGGSVDIVSHILSLCDITVLSGDDALTLPMMSVGAKGVVSVSANIVPQDIFQLCQYCSEGDFSKARDIHNKMFDLNHKLFIETNPLPVKTALAMMGKIKKEFRLPLLSMNNANEDILKKTLEEYGGLL